MRLITQLSQHRLADTITKRRIIHLNAVASNLTASKYPSYIIAVPKDAIVSLRTSYALLGESWAMNEEEFCRIFHEAQNFSIYADIDTKALHDLFLVFDTDCNGLIDTLEFLSTLAVVSGNK